VLEDIDREAAARRQAIESLFGSTPTTEQAPKGRGGRRSGEATS
jgi:hypothetical protein